MVEREPRNAFESFFRAVGRGIDGPATWVKEKVVEPNQQHYPWYHQKFRRVATIDQCYTDDVVCIHEAEAQYRRDRHVDSEILAILKDRYEDCCVYERPDQKRVCAPLFQAYNEASTNWFIKYGDMGALHDAKTALMKQKHRMIWERRHGPVGTGMKKETATE
ncbi:NADH dehydrogenase [ubiquinone] 1 beta subcomplex subunit 10 [Euwallacea similis]|uniref:NADH dehydrogenase [ubiquinone] 1 beta subcomplex subunit 10 n=1 Tax=Euwallacea similis TaxID=1736056 RepID=UPI00344DB208